jgi:hypothetical protein
MQVYGIAVVNDCREKPVFTLEFSGGWIKFEKPIRNSWSQTSLTKPIVFISQISQFSRRKDACHARA